jgi:transcription elongation factor Elf1
MNLPDKPVIPCFLCGKELKVKISKADKPYFICDVCGLQSFVRYRAGIRRFGKLLDSYSEEGDKFVAINESSFETLTLIARLDELGEKLEKVRENKSLTDYFLSDTESELAEKALEREIRNVRDKLVGN